MTWPSVRSPVEMRPFSWCSAASRDLTCFRSAAPRKRRSCRTRPERCRCSGRIRTASSLARPVWRAITTPRSPRWRCETAVTVPESDEIARLTAQLDAASDAARDAYRDTGRLIRLLTVLSVPSTPDELLSQALAVLSETFNADVVCIASVIGDDLLVTAATGLAEDDPTVADGWRLGPAAAEAIVRRQPVATAIDPSGKDVPPSLGDLNLRSVAFVPMSASSERSTEMLVLYRSSGETYSTADLYVLASIAQRLRASMEDRERAVAIERLAQSGHLLAPHLDPESLVQTAADLMQRLTNSDDAWMVGISDGMAYRRAHHGVTELTSDVPDHLRVTELGAWPHAKQGKPWTSVAAGLSGAGPNRAAMCVP